MDKRILYKCAIAILGKKYWIKRAYKKAFNRYPNFKNPTLLSEKIQVDKLFNKALEHTVFADKFYVRQYVQEAIGENHLIKNHAYLTSDRDILAFNFKKYSQGIVVKASHGSGQVDIIRQPQIEEINWAHKTEKYISWLMLNYYSATLEPQYKNLKPGIIIEELLLDSEGKIPNDYKFHCFNGKVELIHIATDREQRSGRIFYDALWNDLNFMWSPIKKDGSFYKSKSDPVKRPQNLEQLIHIAEKLARPFPYVRVDLYNLCQEPKFSELTFHSGSGFDVFKPEKYDLIYGQKFILPNYKTQSIKTYG